MRWALLTMLALMPFPAAQAQPQKEATECAHLLGENQTLQMKVRELEDQLKQTKTSCEAKLDEAHIKLLAAEKREQHASTAAKLDQAREQIRTAIFPVERWQKLLIRDEPLTKSQITQLIGPPGQVIKGKDEDSFRTERWFYPGRVSVPENPSKRQTLVISFGGILVEKIAARAD